MARRVGALLRDLRPHSAHELVITLAGLTAWDPQLVRVLGQARIHSLIDGGHIELVEVPTDLVAALNDLPPRRTADADAVTVPTGGLQGSVDGHALTGTGSRASSSGAPAGERAARRVRPRPDVLSNLASRRPRGGGGEFGGTTTKPPGDGADHSCGGIEEIVSHKEFDIWGCSKHLALAERGMRADSSGLDPQRGDAPAGLAAPPHTLMQIVGHT